MNSKALEAKRERNKAIVKWIGWKVSKTWYTDSKDLAITDKNAPIWAQDFPASKIDFDEDWNAVMFLYERMITRIQMYEAQHGTPMPKDATVNQVRKWSNLVDQMMGGVMEANKKNTFNCLLKLIEMDSKINNRGSKQKS